MPFESCIFPWISVYFQKFLLANNFFSFTCLQGLKRYSHSFHIWNWIYGSFCAHLHNYQQLRYCIGWNGVPVASRPGVDLFEIFLTHTFSKLFVKCSPMVERTFFMLEFRRYGCPILLHIQWTISNGIVWIMKKDSGLNAKWSQPVRVRQDSDIGAQFQ